MNFYFRTNLNKKIGIGHYMRCRRLADYFKKKGHKSFIFVDSKKEVPKQEKNILEMYNVNQNFQSQILDASKFIKKIKNGQSGYVIVDDYRLGALWEKKISKHSKKIISIDDFENRKHFSDIYINQKTKFLINNKIKSKIFLKKNTKQLLGPDYSIIDKTIKTKKSNQFTLIFNFGGSGDLKFSYYILKELYKFKNTNVRSMVVIGPLSKNKKLIYDLKEKNKLITIIENKINLNQLYSRAHLFIGTAGNSVYETVYNRLLSILFQTNENQSNSIKALELIGHYFFLNLKDLNSPKKISELINHLVYNYETLKKDTFKPKFIIDNKGKERILAEILSLKKVFNNPKNFLFNNKIKDSKYTIRIVKNQDINDYLEARNHLMNRKFSFNKSKIDRVDHYNWWFKNQRTSYALEKNNEIKLYFYHYPFNIQKKNFIMSGWFAKSQNCNIQDIIYALNWQKNINKNQLKADFWFSVVKKNNLIALKYSKYLGWKELDSKNNLYKEIGKKFNKKKFIFFQREI